MIWPASGVPVFRELFLVMLYVVAIALALSQLARIVQSTRF